MEKVLNTANNVKLIQIDNIQKRRNQVRINQLMEELSQQNQMKLFQLNRLLYNQNQMEKMQLMRYSSMQKNKIMMLYKHMSANNQMKFNRLVNLLIKRNMVLQQQLNQRYSMDLQIGNLKSIIDKLMQQQGQVNQIFVNSRMQSLANRLYLLKCLGVSERIRKELWKTHYLKMLTLQKKLQEIQGYTDESQDKFRHYFRSLLQHSYDKNATLSNA